MNELRSSKQEILRNLWNKLEELEWNGKKLGNWDQRFERNWNESFSRNWQVIFGRNWKRIYVRSCEWNKTLSWKRANLQLKDFLGRNTFLCWCSLSSVLVYREFTSTKNHPENLGKSTPFSIISRLYFSQKFFSYSKRWRTFVQLIPELCDQQIGLFFF